MSTQISIGTGCAGCSDGDRLRKPDGLYNREIPNIGIPKHFEPFIGTLHIAPGKRLAGPPLPLIGERPILLIVGSKVSRVCTGVYATCGHATQVGLQLCWASLVPINGSIGPVARKSACVRAEGRWDQVILC